MNRARKLAIFTVVVAQCAVGVAIAQNQAAQPQAAPPNPNLFPPPGAQPAAAEPTVKVLTMEEADKLMTEMDAIVIEVQKLYAKTQKTGDALKSLCVNDKLSQLKKVQESAKSVKKGIGAPATRLKASGDLQKAQTETVRLHKEALICVGEKSAEDKDKEEGGASSESEGGEGEGGGAESGGSSFGGIPADPFVSLPPVISSATG